MKIDAKKALSYIKDNRKTVISAAVLLAAILVIAFFGKVTYTSDDDGFSVDGWLASEITVSFDSVRAISQTEELEAGNRKSGMETGRVYVGTFENEAYGQYTLYAYKSVPLYITVVTDGGTVVFNCNTVQKTADAYYDILTKMNSLKNNIKQ